MGKIGFALSMVALLLILALRPSPRGWTEQRAGEATPTPTATMKVD